MKKFSAIVDDKHLKDINAIAEKLKQFGCTIDSIAQTTGVISGSTPDIQILLKAKIAGIEAIEEQRKVRVQ